MGSVYKAFDPSLNRYVAIKFLHRNDPAQTAQFLREARSQARVDHPNVCRVYEVGEVAGRPYIAMQFIDGLSLAEIHDVLPVEAKVRLVRDVARAVHAAHRMGLIHRDLKPGNVLVGKGEGDDFAPHVVDFGLARDAEDTGLTRPGTVTGTPAYLSPEQALGQTLDRRTDVYSLGVVLYELLGGRPPFQGENPPQTLIRLIREEAVPLSKLNPAVPRDLETVVMKCLEKDPNRRYDSARSLADDLERWLAGDAIAARPASWAYRLGKRLRKNRAAAAVAAAAVLSLLVLGAVTVRNHWRARETAELAQRFGQEVKEVADTMRLAALLPRHDITAHKAELSRQLAGIETEMARLGSLAEGPGHAALGQGFLALHQYELARRHLEAAWQAGPRTPEVAASLGRAIGLLYERALVDTGPSRGPEAGDTARRGAGAHPPAARPLLPQGGLASSGVRGRRLALPRRPDRLLRGALRRGPGAGAGGAATGAALVVRGGPARGRGLRLPRRRRQRGGALPRGPGKLRSRARPPMARWRSGRPAIPPSTRPNAASRCDGSRSRRRSAASPTPR